MTSDDLQRMRAIVEAADSDPFDKDDSWVAFVDAARTDWPACLDEIERLRTAIFELAWTDKRYGIDVIQKLLGPDGVGQYQAWREKAGRG